MMNMSSLRLKSTLVILMLAVVVLVSACSSTLSEKRDFIAQRIGTADAAAFSSKVVQLALESSLPVSAVEMTHRDSTQSGGFSTLWVSSDCERMITISDYSQHSSYEGLARSRWFEASLHFDDHDRLIAVDYLRSGQLKDIDGRIISGAIESMAWDGKGFLIAFDDRGEIYRYPGKQPDATLLSGKPEMFYKGENLSQGNAGLESLAALPDGRIFALWEKHNSVNTSVAWLISQHHLRTFSYDAVANPSGATSLPDGSLLIIERAFVGIVSGVRVRVMRLYPSDFTGSDQHLKGHVVFDATSRSLDNFEGVSACRRHGKTFVLAISDNNGDGAAAFNLQSTLLMMLELKH